MVSANKTLLHRSLSAIIPIRECSRDMLVLRLHCVRYNWQLICIYCLLVYSLP